jgi:hypothetical protein
MKRFTIIALAVIFFASLGVAQNQTILKEFLRASYFFDTKLNIVLLTDKTIDIFFAGASKDAINEKISGTTAFYIFGVPEKKVKLVTKFVVEQGGEKINGSIINIKNFEDGEVPKGENIRGILKLDKKINLTQTFVIKGPGGVLDFKLSDDALRMLPR